MDRGPLRAGGWRKGGGDQRIPSLGIKARL